MTSLINPTTRTTRIKNLVFARWTSVTRRKVTYHLWEPDEINQALIEERIDVRITGTKLTVTITLCLNK